MSPAATSSMKNCVPSISYGIDPSKSSSIQDGPVGSFSNFSPNRFAAISSCVGLEVLATLSSSDDLINWYFSSSKDHDEGLFTVLLSLLIKVMAF